MKTVKEVTLKGNAFLYGKNNDGNTMLLCASALDELVKLPEDTNKVVLVPLKRASVDTVLIEKVARGIGDPEGYMIRADGTEYCMNYVMGRFLNDWIDAGYRHVRVEY